MFLDFIVRPPVPIIPNMDGSIMDMSVIDGIIIIMDGVMFDRPPMPPKPLEEEGNISSNRADKRSFEIGC